MADVAKLDVFVNLARVEVAVVVEDRHITGRLVELTRGVGREQEVLVHEFLHNRTSVFLHVL